MSLEERITTLQNKGEDPSTLINEYMPFITATASKIVGRQLGSCDEETAVALEAFNEAIDSFDPSRGRFLGFAKIVIERRIIDYLRGANRRNQEIPFSTLYTGDDDSPAIYDVPDDSQRRTQDLKEEIEALSDVLAAWGISFSKLASASPRSQKTRQACANAVQALLMDCDAYGQMEKTGRLPLTQLEKSCSVHRKTLERHRIYIMAVAEIIKNDYPCLREYVTNAIGGSKW